MFIRFVYDESFKLILIFFISYNTAINKTIYYLNSFKLTSTVMEYDIDDNVGERPLPRRLPRKITIRRYIYTLVVYKKYTTRIFAKIKSDCC